MTPVGSAGRIGGGVVIMVVVVGQSAVNEAVSPSQAPQEFFANVRQV